jgi:hypothetical protein
MGQGIKAKGQKIVYNVQQIKKRHHRGYENHLFQLQALYSYCDTTFSDFSFAGIFPGAFSFRLSYLRIAT